MEIAQTSPRHALAEACNREDGICGQHPYRPGRNVAGTCGRRNCLRTNFTRELLSHCKHQERGLQIDCSVRVTIHEASGSRAEALLATCARNLDANSP